MKILKKIFNILDTKITTNLYIDISSIDRNDFRNVALEWLCHY